MVINPIIFIINDYENNVGYPHKFDNIILLNSIKFMLQLFFQEYF